MTSPSAVPARRRATPLVGRDAELALLEAELHRDSEPGLRVALITGDPGAGKTRLADEVVHRRRRDAVTLSARGHPLGTAAAFGLWAEAVGRHVRSLTPDQIEQACGGFADDLAALLHAVAAIRRDGSAEPPRARLLEGLAVLLESVAGGGRLLIVLDDVHLADASSWDALHFLADRIRDGHVLVIATARPRELSRNQAAAPVLVDLARDGLLTRIELAPLDTTAIRALADAVLGQAPAGLVRWLDDRARGNPLFTSALLRALRETGAPLDPPRLDHLPADLGALVLPRVQALDAAHRDLLELLAVLGGRVELADLAELADHSAQELASIMRDLADSRLLVEAERSRRITCEIAHPLIQEVIYAAIVPARRRELHRRAGRALLAQRRLGAAAPHFVRSADPGDSEAVGVLLEALAEAERREAHQEGLEVLAGLLEVLPPGDQRWAEALDALSDTAEWVVNHLGDTAAIPAVRAMRAIDEVLADSDDPARQAKAKFRLASFLIWGTGELEEAEVLGTQATVLFDAAGQQAAARWARYELAHVAAHRGDFAAFLTGAERVLDEAVQVGDPHLEMHATFLRGFAHFGLGNLVESGACYDRADELARVHVAPYRMVVHHMVRSLSLAYGGALEPAMNEIAAGKAIPGWRDSALPEWQIIALWLAGDCRGAVAAAGESLARHPTGVGRRRTLGFPYATLAALELDDLDAARRFLREAKTCDRLLFHPACLRHAQGMLAWREKAPAAAFEKLRAAADVAAALGCQHVAAPILVDVCELAALSRRPDLAAPAAIELTAIADARDGDLYRALAELGAGWAAQAKGCSAVAAAAAARAFELLRPTGYRLFRGRAAYLWGTALAGSAKYRGLAVTALQNAIIEFDTAGATARRALALRALADLGSQGRRGAAAAAGPTALTGRERQVARLATQGLPVRRIAAELFIGERTVETHLSNLYAKLGISSKSDLIGRAAEFDGSG